MSVTSLISRAELRSATLFHQHGQLRQASCTNCSCVDTKHGLKGKAFGTFFACKEWRHTLQNTTMQFLGSSFCWRSLTIRVMLQAKRGRFKPFHFWQRHNWRGMLSLHMHEPSLKLGGSCGICEWAVAHSPSFASQRYNTEVFLSWFWLAGYWVTLELRTATCTYYHVSYLCLLVGKRTKLLNCR